MLFINNITAASNLFGDNLRFLINIKKIFGFGSYDDINKTNHNDYEIMRFVKISI